MAGDGAVEYKRDTKEECREMLASICDIAKAFINFLQVWLPAHDLDKIEPINISSWKGKGLMSPHYSLRDC